MTERPYFSIGEVLGLLLEEFSDVTISKIRFLESQGLIDPERTTSGYRKFYDGDVERLRYILREQKDNYLPLKVIKERLDGNDNTLPNPPRPVPTGASWAMSPEAAMAARVRHDPFPGEPPSTTAEPVTGPVVEPITSPPARDADPSEPTPRPEPTPEPPAAAREPEPVPAPEPEPQPQQEPERATAPEPVSEPDSRTAAGFAAPPVAPPVLVSPSSPPPTVQPVAQPPAAAVVGSALPVETTAPAETHPASAGRAPVLSIVRSDRSAPEPDLRLSAAELCERAGITPATLRQLEEYSLIGGRALGTDTTYDAEALRVSQLARRLLELGLEVRHLRTWRMNAEKEVSLFEALVLPLLRQRNPQARHHASQTLDELAELGAELRSLLVEAALRSYLER